MESHADRYGLVVRGSFQVDDSDNVPCMTADEPARTLVLFGNAGSSLWEVFSESPEYLDGEGESMDRWSRRIGQQMADELGGWALFPFGGPPYHPFIEWARKAEDLANSRLGMLIHPRYGLWHAYRFAIAFPRDFGDWNRAGAMRQDICISCKEQPCLAACPVEAFNGDHYDVDSCFAYLEARTQSPCRQVTCQARLACPYGTEFRYDAAHAQFHMDAYVRSISARIYRENHGE